MTLGNWVVSYYFFCILLCIVTNQVQPIELDVKFVSSRKWKSLSCSFFFFHVNLVIHYLHTWHLVLTTSALLYIHHLFNLSPTQFRSSNFSLFSIVRNLFSGLQKMWCIYEYICIHAYTYNGILVIKKEWTLIFFFSYGKKLYSLEIFHFLKIPTKHKMI